MVRGRFTVGSLIGLGALLVSAAGCGSSGPELAKVAGVVKINGQPVESVMVEFQPESPGSPSIGYTDAQGRYQLRFSRDRWGALPGPHAVRLNFDYEPGSDDPKPPFKIPAKFNAQTELTADVKRGSNTHDIEITFDPNSRVSSRKGR